MIFSEYLAVAKGAIAQVKGQVRYRALNTGGGWIRDPLNVPQKFAARIKSVNMASENRVAMANSNAGWDDFVDQWVREAVASQTGNCCELSAVAFRHLQRLGVRPVEFFAVYRGSWNHAFVVLNRDQTVPVGDFSTWSKLAVVCDPLYDRAADAGFLSAWYPRMFPLRDGDVKLASL